MISAVLVDDEPLAIKTLRLLLEKHCPEISIVGECNNITDAYSMILEKRPKLIFLDINMPNGTGLELLERFQDVDLEVIFTTAHQEHAIHALRLSALDYILKPISSEDLKNAVQRFMKKKWSSDYHLLAQILQEKTLTRFAVPAVDGIRIINTKEILYLSADKNYTTVHLPDEDIISSKPLGDYEKLLRDHGFFRIHRSFIINLRRLLKFKKGKEAQVVLDNGMELDVSRNRKDELIREIEKIA